MKQNKCNKKRTFCTDAVRHRNIAFLEDNSVFVSNLCFALAASESQHVHLYIQGPRMDGMDEIRSVPVATVPDN